MASKDDSPTSLHGQPWSVWADRLGRDSPLSDTDDQSKNGNRKEADAMKLPKEDMTYYGLCPVRDEFYLVTCNYCRRVCTPQGLKNHIELKHAQEWSSSCNPQAVDAADSSAPPVAASAATGLTSRPKTAKKAQAAGQAATVPTSLAYLLATPAAPPSNNNSRSRGNVANKRGAGKSAAALPTPLASALMSTAYDKIPSPQQPPPPPPPPLPIPPSPAIPPSAPVPQASALPVQFSPLQPTLTAPSPVSPLTSGSNVLTPSPAITMTVAVDSSGNQTVQIHLPELGNGVTLADSPADVAPAIHRGQATGAPASSSTKKRKNSAKADGTGRRLLPLKERELDLEKHCGVWIGDIHRACTRSLTCKAHSLTLRRNVQGRSRSFDDLLAEHRAAKEFAVKQLKEGTAVQASGPSLPQGAATRTPTATPTAAPSSAQQAPKLGRPPISRPPPAKKLLTSLLQQQQTGSTELSISVDQPPPPSTDASSGGQHAPSLSSGLLLQRVATLPSTPVPQQQPTSLTFTLHHPKPLAVCSFGLRRRQVLGVVTTDRKWDFLRTAMRATLLRPSATTTATAKTAVGRTSGLQSLLRPSLIATQQLQNHHLNNNSPLQPCETNSIELPNGLQLSIGVQPDGLNHGNGHHRVRLKKSLLNGLVTPGGHSINHNSLHQIDPIGPQPPDDLMEELDGLVGEDGVLTFLNQGTEGTASLSLMADLSAGNITFSEMNNHHSASGGMASSGGVGTTRLLPSAASTGPASFLLQPDPGDFM